MEWVRLKSSTVNRTPANESVAAEPLSAIDSSVVRSLAPWPMPTERSREWTVRYALVAYLVAWSAATLLILVLELGDWKLHVGVRVLIFDAMLLAALIPLRRSGGLALSDLGVRRAPAVRSVGLSLFALVIVGIFNLCWSKVVPHHFRASAANPFIGVSEQSSLNIGLTAVTAVIIAPIVEEVFFRGFLYRSLRNRLPVFAAALIAGAMFGLAHAGSYPVVTLPAKAFFGFVMCLLFERTGSLLPGIAIHSFIDGGIFEGTLTGNAHLVVTGFLLMVVALLVQPPLRALVRLHAGEAMFGNVRLKQ